MTPRPIADLALVGGRACLDFANTASGRGGPRHLDHLGDAGRVVDWARHAGVIDDAEHRRMRVALKASPAEAVLVAREAIALRECVHRIFAAIAGHRAPDPGDLALLNRWLERTYPHVALVPARNGPAPGGPAQGGPAPGGFTLGWRPELPSPEAVLRRIVRSAVDVLTLDPPERIKQCIGRDCGFLFFDATRNNSRRWCEMSVCGNRAKAQRAYRRRRGVPAE